MWPAFLLSLPGSRLHVRSGGWVWKWVAHRLFKETDVQRSTWQWVFFILHPTALCWEASESMLETSTGKPKNTHTIAQWEKGRSSTLIWSRKKEFPGPWLINFIKVYGLPSDTRQRWLHFSKEELMLVKSLRAILRFPKQLMEGWTLGILSYRCLQGLQPDWFPEPPPSFWSLWLCSWVSMGWLVCNFPYWKNFKYPHKRREWRPRTLIPITQAQPGLILYHSYFISPPPPLW